MSIVDQTREGDILVLTINNPPVNAFSPGVPEGLHAGLDAAEGDEGPGGIALLDHDTFEVKGTWEKNRGPQYLAYDFWWHINHDRLITSEWGTPRQIENGVDVEDHLANDAPGCWAALGAALDLRR